MGVSLSILSEPTREHGDLLMSKQNVFRSSFLWFFLSFLFLFWCFPALSQTKRVYHIRVDGVIDRGLAPYISRVLQDAANADAVVLEVDTLGGRVDAALQIRDALLNVTIPTIAFINKRAISAGALISLAADHIVMAPGATIGAATPVQMDMTGGANPVTEKYVSYFRAEMRATAEETGRRGDIAEAMVDAEYTIEGISEEGKLLTLTTDNALEYNIAEYERSSLDEVLETFELGDADILRAESNWAEKLVRFLTHPGISMILMIAGFLGIFIEVKTPGFGLGGTVGVVCLGLFFWGHFFVRLAGWEELILFLAGVILLLIELLIIPGFGVVGFLGIMAILTSLALSLVGRFEFMTWNDVQMALSKVTAALIGSIILAVVLVKFLPRTSFGKQVILQTTEERENGYVAQREDLSKLVGLVGKTTTPLNPSGIIFLDGNRYDVVSEAEFIEKNTQVKVIKVEGSRIVVRKVEE